MILNEDYNELFDSIQKGLMSYQDVKVSKYTSKDINKMLDVRLSEWLDGIDFKEYVRKAVNGGLNIKFISMSKDGKSITYEMFSTNLMVDLVETSENKMGLKIQFRKKSL